MKKDILICGVGGQGTVLASTILAASAMVAGDAVHSAETIGMAQRGGPVTSHVRIGDDAYSPLIPCGSADLILAFEPSEAVRNLCYLKKGGTVIVNSVPVKPVTESLNDTGYDGTEMLSYLRGKCDCIVIDGEELSKEFGSSRYFNIAILGVAAGAGRLGIPQEIVLGEIVKRVPARFTDTNKAAFQEGAEIGAQYAVNS
ncbi:MAG: indolepyruvate oxidoreductase subunit beta [Lachnospiraceae bacterium]|nr:indolepyruvate oxidoreductase subunit beta [Lachnospiraceae bacterium]